MASNALSNGYCLNVHVETATGRSAIAAIGPHPVRVSLSLFAPGALREALPLSRMPSEPSLPFVQLFRGLRGHGHAAQLPRTRQYVPVKIAPAGND